MVSLLYHVFSKLPIRVLYFFSDLINNSIISFYRNKIVEKNLINSFPEYDSKKIKKIKKGFYKNFCDLVFETIKSISIKENELKKRVKFNNLHLINDHVNKDERVVVLTSHQCNWEWLLLAAELKLDTNLHVIYKKLKNRNFDKLMYESRSRFGSILMESSEVIMYLRNHLKKVKVLAVVADQSPKIKSRKIWAQMLNQKTAFLESIEFIPKFTESYVYYASMKKTSRGNYEVNFKKIAQPKNFKTHQILEKYIGYMESQIYENPSEWLWSHRRWKLTPENSQ